MNLSQQATTLIIATLAIWRVTHLLWGEDGPGDVFVRLRRLAGEGFFGRLLDCFYCLTVWVAAPFAGMLGNNWLERGVLWFGLSGGAILLERMSAGKPGLVPHAHWTEQVLPGMKAGDQDDVLVQ